MILTAVSPPPAKTSAKFSATESVRFLSSTSSKSYVPIPKVERRINLSRRGISCTNKDNADDLFEGSPVLSPGIPWDTENTWSTFALYFFSLHIPLSLGGLSIVAQVLHQPVLDPLTKVLSAVILQTTECAGVLALLSYITKPGYDLSSFFFAKLFSKQRSWLRASALGILFLIALVVLTSVLADRLLVPKDVNSPVLKEILLYSSTSKTSCFVLYCLIAPLLEETVYRGFLLTSLVSTMEYSWQAVIISSIFFSVSHFSGENSVQLFLIGCLLGSVYCWSGNIAASFTVHSMYNAIILLITIMS